MINYSKLKTAIKLCWLVLFTVYLGCLFTQNYLTIVVENEVLQAIDVFITSPVPNLIVSFVMYYFNILIIYHAILRKQLFKYKPILLSVIITVSWILKTVFINYEIVNYLDFITLGLLIIFIPKKWYRVVLGTLFVFVVTLVSSIIKDLFIFQYTELLNTSMIVVLIYSIDMYIIDVLYYLYSRKEEVGHEQISVLWKAQMVKIKNYWRKCCSWNRSTLPSSSTNSSFLVETYCSIIFFILTYSILLLVGILCNRWLEITISVFAFHILREKDSKTFHAETSIKCFITSIISFSIVMSLEFPLDVSIFASILLAYWLSTVMYFIQDYLDLHMKFKPQTFYKGMTTLPEGLQGVEYDIMYQYYVKRKSLDKIAMNLGYSVDGIKKIKAKILKRYS